MTASPLAGRRVLVTRPAERAGSLCEALEANGATAVRFPVIAIEPADPALAPPAPGYDAALFVSPAAVEHGLERVRPAMAPRARFGAVGSATAAALEARGVVVELRPRGPQTTEGLLAAPGLAAERVAGQHILIVRGVGGREALAEGLVARGASVDYAEVYRRRRPPVTDPARAAGCELLTVTSVEGLDNLLALVDEATAEHLRRCPLAVTSERVAGHASAAGFRYPPEVAGEPGDAGMVAALERCARRLAQDPPESA